jgi:hypothetical protein
MHFLLEPEFDAALGDSTRVRLRVLQGVALLPLAAWAALHLLAPMLAEVRALQESATTCLIGFPPTLSCHSISFTRVQGAP